MPYNPRFGRGFGPDLTNIGAQRSTRDLARAITQPGTDPRGGSKGTEVRTADGRTMRGVIVTENTFSLYLRDRAENLYLLTKSGSGKECTARKDLKSMMPVIPLDPKQVDDLLRFSNGPAEVEPDLSVWKPAAGFQCHVGPSEKFRRRTANWLHYWGDLRAPTSAASNPSPPPIRRIWRRSGRFSSAARALRRRRSSSTG